MSAEKDEKKGGSQTGKRDQREATCTRPVEFYHQGQGGILGIRPNPSEGEGPGRCRCQAFSCWTLPEREPRVGILGIRRPGAEAVPQPAEYFSAFTANTVLPARYQP